MLQKYKLIYWKGDLGFIDATDAGLVKQVILDGDTLETDIMQIVKGICELARIERTQFQLYKFDPPATKQ